MIKPISDKRRVRLAEYKKLRKWFLVEHNYCEWGLRQTPPQHIRATQIHHSRGRQGRLLNDTRFWFAVSEKGHNWIHANIDAARNLGLFCEKGQWNTTPKD